MYVILNCIYASHVISCLFSFKFFCPLCLQSKAGPALIAINPFKDIQLYGNEFVTAYRQKLLNDPHVYSIADTAYDRMMEGYPQNHVHSYYLQKFIVNSVNTLDAS